MNKPHLTASFIIATLFSALFLAAARADETASSISFSDPAKPGTLRIRVARGNVSIHGADVNVLTVKTDSQPAESAPRDDGLRVLSTSSTYTLNEKNNVVNLEYGMESWTGSSADFNITVPRSTSVSIGGSFGGNVSCAGVSGDLDIRSMNGRVHLDDVGGGACVCVETMNGEIKVDAKALSPGKPMVLSSMNGSVVVRLPKDAKASVQFRTHNGKILTNFDDKALVTKTEISRRSTKRSPASGATAAPAAPGASAAPSAPADPAVPSAPAAAPSAATPATSAAAASGSDSTTASEAPTPSSGDDDWHTQFRDSLREASDAAAYAAHMAVFAVHEGVAAAAAGTEHTMPPLPPLTGGKIVSGTLNGGGPELQVTTMNGNITLRTLP